MNTPRSSRPLGPALSLALVVLLGACAQNPAATDAAGTPGAAEPPPPLGASAAAPTPPATAPTAASEAVAVRPDRPETYTVAPGDTLWSIAARFLKKPWQWREIWRQNPQLRNPNRIYPGDVLRFSYTADGQPQLQVAEREDVPLLKLSPQVRAEALTQPIPPVPRDAIDSFLTRAQILSEREWQQMPYIIADDENQVVYTNRDRVYARGALFDQPRYQVFRPGEALLDPGSGQSLGVAGLYLGVAVLERDEDPASFLLSEVIGPVRAGDRLLPVDEERELYNFEPHPVPPDTEGLIIAKLDPDVTQITQYSSVIVNLGAQEGMEPGHVLAIYGKPRTVVDPISGNDVQLPGERAGLLMLYKIHDLVSYALVMQAERAIRMNDRVTTP